MSSNIVTVILLMLCQCITVFGACLFLRHILNAKQAEIEARAEAALRAWVEAEEPGKPSKLAIALDAAGAVVGSAAGRSLMASLKQQESAVAHVANGAADAINGQQNPLLGLLAGGKRGKGAAVARLADMLGKMFLTGTGSGKAPQDGNHREGGNSLSL